MEVLYAYASRIHIDLYHLTGLQLESFTLEAVPICRQYRRRIYREIHARCGFVSNGDGTFHDRPPRQMYKETIESVGARHCFATAIFI